MKKKIKHLFIILTPFQKTVINQLFNKKLLQENSLILYSNFVEQEEGPFERFCLKNHDFSRKRLFKHPLKYIGVTKENVREAKEDIKLLNEKYEFSEDLEMYMGTDKDVFTQLIINDLLLEKKKRTLTLVDEGIGYYINTKLNDRMLSLIYRFFTPMLFGSRLIYITKLGTHPKIDEIYLRAPELIAQKNDQINYIKFKLENQNFTAPTDVTIGVLLYSFPNLDCNISNSFKIKLLKEIALHLKNHNKQLFIKPHPREDAKHLKEQLSGIDNVRILDNKIIGESLNYFEYEFILNFFSSIIIDLIEQDYPKEKILTIGFTKKPLIHLGDELKYCYIKNFKASTFIKLD